MHKVLLITDIGGDIDDVLALYVLLSQLGTRVDLLGIVVCGGVHEQRAFLTRQLLQKLGGMGMAHIPVIAPSGDKDIRSSHEFSMPDEFLSLWHNNVPHQKQQNHDTDADVDADTCDASQFIIDTVNKYPGQVNVMVIGPLTPLSNAINENPYFAANVRTLYVQGQVLVDSELGRLLPDVHNSYNLREDPDASHNVFSHLQNHRVPFVVLGKYAAYRIPLPKSLFQSLSTDRHPIHILNYAKKALDAMWRSAPELLYRIYRIPEEHQCESKWFDALHHISYPYDPLLIMALLEPDLFDPTVLELRTGTHRIIGNEPNLHGIPSPDAVFDKLVQYLTTVRMSDHSDGDTEQSRFIFKPIVITAASFLLALYLSSHN